MYLAGLFGSMDKERVLQFILARNRAYATQIAKFYKVNTSQIVKQLESLEFDKVVVSFQYGKVRLYEFNPQYYFRDELKALLLKSREIIKIQEPELYNSLVMVKTAPRRKGKPDFKKPANAKEYNVAEKADQACEKIYTLDEVVDELGLCCVKEANEDV